MPVYGITEKIIKLEGGRYRPLERESVLEKSYTSGISPVWLPEQKEWSSRRIFHGLERQYLSIEAQSMASCLLNSQSVPPDVTENVIQQAVVLGTMSDSKIDIQTFEALFYAVTLNPLFKIPFSAAAPLLPFSHWVC
jgi:hypothetical protein